MALLKASEIKKLVKEGNKRCSKEFIAAFENHVSKELQRCIAAHNSGKKTLDAVLVTYELGSK